MSDEKFTLRMLIEQLNNLAEKDPKYLDYGVLAEGCDCWRTVDGATIRKFVWPDDIVLTTN